MSGGHFDYIQYQMNQTADDLNELITTTQESYSPATIAEFVTGLHYLQLAAIYIHRIDYLVSCDDSEDSFHSHLMEQLNEYYARLDQSRTG